MDKIEKNQGSEKPSTDTDDIEANEGDEKPVSAEADASLDSQVPNDDLGAYDNKSKALIATLMSALCIAVFLAALDATIIATPLPTIAEHFHSSAGYTWVGSAFLLASAASTPLWGKISDIFGRKPVLLMANALFFIGSLVAALAINIGMLIVARVIQGIGAAGLLTMVDIVVCDLFSQRTRGLYLGVIGAVWAIAGAIGPVLGGALTDAASWRWCFYINLPLDGVAFVIILFFLKLNTPKTPLKRGLPAIDWIGALLVAGGTTTILFGLQYGGQTRPWSSAPVICLLVFGLVQIALFVLYEWKVAHYPIMPLRLFYDRSNIGCLLVSFFHGLSFIGVYYYLPLYFQAVQRTTPLMSGVYTLPLALGTGVSAILTGGLVGSTGWYLPPMYTALVLTTLGLGLCVDLPTDREWAKLVIYQLIVGIGIGPNFISPLIGLQTRLEEGDIAAATATFNMLRNLATAIGVIIGQTVYQNEFGKRQGALRAELGSEGVALTNSGIEANLEVIKHLPPTERRIASDTFNASLQSAWIMYTCFAAAALVAGCLVRKRTLSTEHKITQTGLDAEDARVARRKAGD